MRPAGNVDTDLSLAADRYATIDAATGAITPAPTATIRRGEKLLRCRPLTPTDSRLTRHVPTFRTIFGIVWDIRKRVQWCLLPLGMNYLPADAVEYLEIELNLTSFDRGKPMSVPGIRH